MEINLMFMGPCVSWLLGNVYTTKSCKGEKRVPDASKLGLVS